MPKLGLGLSLPQTRAAVWFSLNFWTNLSLTAGKVITGFNSTFTNAMTVDWGDGTTTPLISGVSVNKTLGTTNAIQLKTNNAVVTDINCGTSSPKLGGNIDLSAFPNLTDFTCINNDITAISGYENNPNTRLINFSINTVSGTIPSLNGAPALREYSVQQNILTGNIPNLNTNLLLRVFRCENQIGTTKITGPIPQLNSLSNLEIFYCNSNQLTGSIPSLNGNPALREFLCNTNNLTGTIPSLASNTSLRLFRCHTNAISGNIPTLNANNALEIFHCHTQQGSTKIIGFDGGSVSNTLGDFQAQNNQLTSAAVNAILAAFVAANKTTGTRILNLGGPGNAAPTGQGITDKATLISRGWTVTTN